MMCSSWFLHISSSLQSADFVMISLVVATANAPPGDRADLTPGKGLQIQPRPRYPLRAADHRDGQFPALIEFVNRVGQTLADREVHCLTRVRPIDRDDKHAPAELRENFVRHS